MMKIADLFLKWKFNFFFFCSFTVCLVNRQPVFYIPPVALSLFMLTRILYMCSFVGMRLDSAFRSMFLGLYDTIFQFPFN